MSKLVSIPRVPMTSSVGSQKDPSQVRSKLIQAISKMKGQRLREFDKHLSTQTGTYENEKEDLIRDEPIEQSEEKLITNYEQIKKPNPEEVLEVEDLPDDVLEPEVKASDIKFLSKRLELETKRRQKLEKEVEKLSTYLLRTENSSPKTNSGIMHLRSKSNF